MNKKIEGVIHSKSFLIAMIIVLIILVGAASTYAWFTWNSTSNTNLTMSIGASSDIVFKTGNNISTTKLAPVFNYSDGESTSFSIIRKNKSDTTNVAYKVILSITSIAEELKSTSFKYILIDSNSKVEVANGDFSNITNNSTIILVESILSERADYTLYIYIDGNEENNLNMINKKFEAVLTATAEEKVVNYELTNGDGSTYTPTYSGTGTKTVRSSATKSTFKEVKVDDVVVAPSNYTVTEGSTIITFTETYLKTLSVGNHTVKIISNDGYASGTLIINTNNTAAQYITNLYTSGTKKAVVNNSTTYQYDTTHNLMKDVGNNVRYYGLTPNNYIYFNCGTYPSTNCETWRIIGVFDGKVKIMRNESIGAYSWDTSDINTYSGYGANEWSDAKLMKLLNAGYTGIGGSLYWNSKSGSCYNDWKNTTTSCDFTSTGLKNDTTRNLIAEVTYNLGGWSDPDIYSNEIYDFERGTTVYEGRSTTWTGKIAVPYISDYGYSADLSLGGPPMTLYYVDEANSWMKKIFTDSQNEANWLLTPSTEDDAAVFYTMGDGSVAFADFPVTNGLGVFPVLHLEPAVSILSGTGTSTDPYRLSI